MESESNDLIHLDEKIDFNGTKENIITLKCQDCTDFILESRTSEGCILCLINVIKKYKNLKSSIIMLNQNKQLFVSNDVEYLKTYFLNQNKLIKIWSKIESFRKCIYKEFECKIIPSFKKKVMDLNRVIDDPIQFYEKIRELKKKLEINQLNESNCLDCLVYLKGNLDRIYEELLKFKIVQEYIKFSNLSKLNDRVEFYRQRLLMEPFQPIKSKKFDHQESYSKISSYYIGSKKEFEINIFEVQYESEKLYEYLLNVSYEFNEKYIKNLLNDIIRNFELININEIIKLEDLIEIYTEKALNYIKGKYQLSDSILNKIALYASLKRINLFKIFPFLIDDYVEEIFLDSPNENIYLNHQRFGRCKTKISFNFVEIERLKTFLRVYSNKRLDYSSPSNKLVIKNKFFYCRFAIDVSPIVLNEFALDIRKLNKNVMTIQDLLKNNTLNPEMAAFLYFNVLRRVNFTVTGETNTGKTTLINALDLMVPKEFRKIYVEDINESIDQIRYGRHQLRFRVNSVDEPNHKFSKQNQIKTLLHRTPDIIYLGEILTIDEAKAMFHCLAAGLKGFQTIHANDINSLINRFLYHFKIDKSCLNDLNIIILMKKYHNQRKIVSISEIDENNTKISHIFSYNTQLNKHELSSNLFESKNIIQLRKYENISKDFFFLVLNLYRDVFRTLKKIEKITNEELIKLFDRLSYLSLHSYDQIEVYWVNWKKRNLNVLD
ncbi:MAG: hypothetical protein EU532_14875 [Promethearchaeota archaeon]|nr:MAG: hypothetical protein EU532_14875 [Candidatus Lokiarchaeota archaeon]